MILLNIKKLKKQFYNTKIVINSINPLLIIVFLYLWISIGQYAGLDNILSYLKFYDLVEINFNFLEIFSIGFIHLLIFSFLLINLAFKFIKNKKIPFISIFLIYPISASVGYMNNIDNHGNLNLLVHFFLTISNVFLFFSYLSNYHLNEKIIKLFFKISILFIISFFLIIIIPDMISRLISNTHVREIYFVSLDFFFFDYKYIQNSNGSARITVILFLIIFTKIVFQIEKKKPYKIYLFIIFLLSLIIFYYQSRLSVAFISFYCLCWCFLGKKIQSINKIVLVIVILIIPFFFINFYSNYSNNLASKNVIEDKKEDIRQDQDVDIKQDQDKETVLNFKNKSILNFKNKSIFNFENNRILNISIYHRHKFHVIGAIDKCKFVAENKFVTKFDKYSSGRVCGWEILLRDIDKSNFIFGNGFFYDQKYLKKYQKLSSNTFINIFYNSGLIGLIPILVVFIFILINFKKLIYIYKNSNYLDFLVFNILFYLIVRSIFEDTLAFNSIDLILFMSCFISILAKISRLNKETNNIYFNDKKNFRKNL